MRFGFETEGVRIHAAGPVGYEEGSLGWVVDEPMFFFPDGSAMKTRLTAVLRRETGPGSWCTCTSRSACPTTRWSSCRSAG
jgi:hypothetical protein